MRHAHDEPGTCSTTTTAHRDKRPFQPSITSFFARDDRDTGAAADAYTAADEHCFSHDYVYDYVYDYHDDYNDTEERGAGPISRASQQQHHHHHHQARDNNNSSTFSTASTSHRLKNTRDTGFPSVPGPVQASLLSVGMRVRKSVPEGYKTHKTGPLSLPSIQTTLSNGNRTITASATTTTTAPVVSSNDAYSVKPPRDPVPDALQHQRELLPFCGLHKIGGYAEQPVTNAHLYGLATDANGDKPVNLFPLPAEAFNQPFSSTSSSQSSSSTDSLPTNAHNNKRGWTDDEHLAAPNPTSPFVFALPMKVAEDEVPVSPLSETPRERVHQAGHGQAALRPFAQPKTRRGGQLQHHQHKEADMDLDGEDVGEEGQQLRLGSPGDFGEAPFLRPWSGGAAAEVEMGGV